VLNEELLMCLTQRWQAAGKSFKSCGFFSPLQLFAGLLQLKALDIQQMYTVNSDGQVV